MRQPARKPLPDCQSVTLGRETKRTPARVNRRYGVTTVVNQATMPEDVLLPSLEKGHRETEMPWRGGPLTKGGSSRHPKQCTTVYYTSLYFTDSQPHHHFAPLN